MTDSSAATGHPALPHHPSIDARCCNGGCRRSKGQPPMIMRSDLTGTWWVVTRYKHLGEGRFEALEKHILARESAEQLETLRYPEAADDRA